MSEPVDITFEMSCIAGQHFGGRTALSAPTTFPKVDKLLSVSVAALVIRKIMPRLARLNSPKDASLSVMKAH